MTSLAESLQQHLTRLKIDQVEVLFTDRSPSFRGSSVSEEASTITAQARERHLRDGYGFWEHVISLGVDASPDTRRQLYSAAAREGGAVQTRLPMSVAEFTEAISAGRWQELPGRQMVSLSSRVVTRGTTGHMHLLDLGLRERPGSVDAIWAGIAALGGEGLLLSSGRSYHLYGARIDAWDRYVEFLARAALLSPLVDARWALRQIAAGFSALRVSSNLERDTHAPSPIG